MTRRDSDFPLTLQKKGKEVKIYHSHNAKRGEDYFTVVHYVGNQRKRVNRRKLEDAMKLAREKLDQMAKGQVPVSLDQKDWELLKEVKKLAKDRSPWRVVEDARSATRILGTTTSLTEAAEFFVARHRHRGEVSVGELYELYIREKEQNSSERNLRDIKNRVGKFEDSFSELAIGDITPEAILAFLEALKVTERTKNNYRAGIVTFFRWARKRGYLEEARETAPEKVDAWKVIEKEVTIFSVEEMRKLFLGIREDLEAYAAIAAFAGLRPSEIQRLTWGSVDFESGHIHVTADVARKVNRARYVPMSENLVAWLLPHKKAKSEKVGYFKAPELLSSDAIARGVVEAWPADVLRHSFCSYRLAQTKNIGLVAEEAGNSPSIIRRHYRRPVPAKQATEYFNIRRENLDSEEVEISKAG